MVVAGEITPRPGKSALTLLVELCGPVAQLVEQELPAIQFGPVANVVKARD